MNCAVHVIEVEDGDAHYNTPECVFCFEVMPMKLEDVTTPWTTLVNDDEIFHMSKEKAIETMRDRLEHKDHRSVRFETSANGREVNAVYTSKVSCLVCMVNPPDSLYIADAKEHAELWEELNCGYQHHDVCCDSGKLYKDCCKKEGRIPTARNI